MAGAQCGIPAFEDVVGCQNAVFEWAESYDTKDWERLAQCVTPTLYIDYRSVIGKLFEDLPAEEFVGMVSSAHFLGNQRIKTQHFIGATKWSQHPKNPDEIIAEHQMRVAHQKYKDDELKEVLYQGHALGRATIQYRKIDGVWKFAGLEPDIRWTEYDNDKIFEA